MSELNDTNYWYTWVHEIRMYIIYVAEFKYHWKFATMQVVVFQLINVLKDMTHYTLCCMSLNSGFTYMTVVKLLLVSSTSFTLKEKMAKYAVCLVLYWVTVE